MPHRDLAGWTLGTYVAHNEAMRSKEMELLAERDRRYEERNNANREAVKAALASAEKAGEKTEAALKEYKVASNEWRETVKDLVSRVPSRSEFTQQEQNLEQKIGQQSKAIDMHVQRLDEKITAALAPVTDYIAAARGRGLGTLANMQNISWVIAVISALIAIGSFVFRASPTAPPSNQPIIVMPPPVTPQIPQVPQVPQAPR